ncbi:MAG: hypothetical protein KH366_02325 [Clostridiaceae bacterium]|nr:hypothetical protein [Clostridiaceae bacterium]
MEHYTIKRAGQMTEHPYTKALLAAVPFMAAVTGPWTGAGRRRPVFRMWGKTTNFHIG